MTKNQIKLRFTTEFFDKANEFLTLNLQTMNHLKLCLITRQTDFSIGNSNNSQTTSKNGLMSTADKLKLNGIESAAQKNVIELVKVNNTELYVIVFKISASAVDDY